MTDTTLLIIALAGAALLAVWFVWRCICALGQTDEWNGEW